MTHTDAPTNKHSVNAWNKLYVDMLGYILEKLKISNAISKKAREFVPRQGKDDTIQLP